MARRIGFPVLVRPSYVLGGRAMVIAYDEETVRRYMREAVTFSRERPVLIDRFLEDATEIDVDTLSDSEDVLIAGIMESTAGAAKAERQAAVERRSSHTMPGTSRFWHR